MTQTKEQPVGLPNPFTGEHFLISRAVLPNIVSQTKEDYRVGKLGWLVGDISALLIAAAGTLTVDGWLEALKPFARAVEAARRRREEGLGR